MVRYLYIILSLSIISCSGLNITKPKPEPERQTIFGGPLTYSTETGSFSVGSIGRPNLSNANRKSNITSLPVNELLWNSTLDTLDFMSYEKIDPFGGIIITDWFINQTTKKSVTKLLYLFQAQN